LSDTRHAALHALGNVDRQTLRIITLERLREAISIGELPPGTHLAEIDLSEALSVSRGTLREALRALQHEGLVQSDTRGRLTVRVVDATQVRDIFAVRAALESLAFETICAMPDRSEIIATLSEHLELMESPLLSFSERLEADLNFHAAMCRFSGNETLYTTWLSARGIARSTMTAAGSGSALTNMARSRHSPIIELLEAGDAAGGRVFLHTHMAEAAERIASTMTEA
jgi:DNA-binding GntR family transcriptional regulator